MNHMKDKNIIVGNLDNKEILEIVATYHDDRIAVIDKLQDITIKKAIWMQAVSISFVKREKLPPI